MGAAAFSLPGCGACGRCEMRPLSPYRRLQPEPSLRTDEFDGQRVHAGLQFLVERFHDGPVLGETGLASEAGSGDADAKMRLASGIPPGMASMFLALVDHFKVAWREFDRKFFDNDVSNRHMHTVSKLMMTDQPD